MKQLSALLPCSFWPTSLGHVVSELPLKRAHGNKLFSFVASAGLASGEHSLAVLRRAAGMYSMENNSGKVQRDNSIYILES